MSLFDWIRRRRTPEPVVAPVVEPPKPKLRDAKIEKYRLSNDRTHLIVEYKDGVTDVVEYSKEFEGEILNKYRAQILDTAKDYDVAKKNRKRHIAWALVALAAGGGYASIVASTLAYTAAPLAATLIFAGVATYNIVKAVKETNKMDDLKKPLMIAQNLDVLQSHARGNSNAAELNRVLGRETSVPKITDYEKKTYKEVRREVIAAGGDTSYYDNPLYKAKAKVLKR